MIKVFIFIGTLGFVWSSQLRAQTTIKKSVVSNGGGVASSNEMNVSLTIGQPAVGIVTRHEEKARVGFWYAIGKPEVMDPLIHNRSQPAPLSSFENHPNPFHEQTTFYLRLHVRQKVNIRVLSMDGRLISTVWDDWLEAGSHEITWQANGIPEGPYIVEWQTSDGLIQSEPIILVR